LVSLGCFVSTHCPLEAPFSLLVRRAASAVVLLDSLAIASIAINQTADDFMMQRLLFQVGD
jgi:hypothetical protein